MNYIGEYRVKKKLGAGGFGEVYLVEKGGELYALKKFSNPDNKTFDRFRKEALVIQDLRRKNNLEYLVNIISFNSEKRFYVMEYLKEGLDEYYNRTKDKRVFLKLINGLNELHKIEIAHRDIKPQNLRVRGNEPVIIDFGIASWKGSNSGLGRIGTPGYMPPEVIALEWRGYPLLKEAFLQLQNIPLNMDRNSSKKYFKILHDVYSLGITIGEIITGINPLVIGRNLNLDYFRRGSEVLEDWYRNIESRAGKDFSDFVRKATSFFPSKRPMLDDLLKTCFVAHASVSVPKIVSRVEMDSFDVQTIKCLSCGKLVDAPANFCDRCGAELRFLVLKIFPSNQKIEFRENLPIRVIGDGENFEGIEGSAIIIDISRVVSPFSLKVGRSDSRASIVFPIDNWMSRLHGEFSYNPADNNLVYRELGTPTNPSIYEGFPVSSGGDVLEIGKRLVVGGTIFILEKYFWR